VSRLARGQAFASYVNKKCNAPLQNDSRLTLWSQRALHVYGRTSVADSVSETRDPLLQLNFRRDFRIH